MHILPQEVSESLLTGRTYSVVGIAVAIVVFAANLKPLAVIPASVYGFAATFAFLLQTPGELSLSNLLSLRLNNALIVIALSTAIGAVFGFVSANLGAMLTAKPGAVSAPAGSTAG